MKILPLFCAITLFLVQVLHAENHIVGDSIAGKKGVKKCTSCHSVIDDSGVAIIKGGRSAPNLYGLEQRPIGAVEGFKYSKSFKALYEAGFVWSETEFVEFLADPNKYTKAKLNDNSARSKMAFKLKKPQDAHDIWAYLVSLSKK